MNIRKSPFISIGFVLSVSLISSSLTAFLLTHNDTQKDFFRSVGRYGAVCTAAGFLTGAALFLTALFLLHRKQTAHIRALTDSLEKINTGCGDLLFPLGEDDFSRLQDEIEKTVTMLYQTRDAALKARQNFAENLDNIAHQIKTPVTVISLSAQMWLEDPSPVYPNQIRHQISRLMHLEESLLLLSRMDAGTLPLEKQKVDVFTLLTLAADNLQALLSDAGVSVHIPESGEVLLFADLEWTMEAVINLFKNCMEHTPPGGQICCSYEQNPLYTRIRIQDTGEGFAEEDLPHLFERFYRGKNASGEGIGIGLALSRTIIERQNGIIRAGNTPGHGACFEIRFYRH